MTVSHVLYARQLLCFDMLQVSTNATTECPYIVYTVLVCCNTTPLAVVCIPCTF